MIFYYWEKTKWKSVEEELKMPLAIIQLFTPAWYQRLYASALGCSHFAHKASHKQPSSNMTWPTLSTLVQESQRVRPCFSYIKTKNAAQRLGCPGLQPRDSIWHRNPESLCWGWEGRGPGSSFCGHLSSHVYVRLPHCGFACWGSGMATGSWWLQN